MRVVAFLFGLVLFGGIMGLSQVIAPGAAVPMTFALLLSLLLAGRTWVPRGYLVTIAIGVLTLWYMGTRDPHGELVHAIRRFAGLFKPLGIFTFFVCLTWMAANLGRAERPIKQALPATAALFVFTLLVATFSGDAGGASPMGSWFGALGLTPDQAHIAVLTLRKTIHFVFYATVGFTGTTAARRGGETPGQARLVGLAYALLLSTFDEVRQMSAATRTGSPFDIALDMSGAFVGTLLALRASQRAKQS